MPKVVGRTVEEARNALTDVGLKSEVAYEESDEIRAGEVISADVEEGAEIEEGTTVKLTASAGPQGFPCLPWWAWTTTGPMRGLHSWDLL